MNSLERNPGKLLELSGSFWKTCTLHAAVKLDVFTAIGNNKLTSRDMAQKLGVNERALAMLLNALAALELLEKHKGEFSNTKASSDFLVKNSPKYIGFMIMHHQNLVDSWNKMPNAIISGKPLRGRALFNDEKARENFLMGMFNIAMGNAPGFAKKIDLSGRTRFLDLGGGPGTYAIHFCLNNPGLKATIFDLSTTEPFARKTIEKFKLVDRIDFAGGSFLDDKIPEGHDVAWISHILHGESPDNCQMIIDKTARALKPGAIIFVHDFILKNSMNGPLFPALFSLNMLLGTDGGQAYSEKQIMDMFAKAGLVDIHRLEVTGTNDSGVIAGTVI